MAPAVFARAVSHGRCSPLPPTAYFAYALKFDLLTMAAAGTACASALRFARFVTPDILETAVTRAIEPKLLFAFATADDAPLAAGWVANVKSAPLAGLPAS